MIAVQIDHFEDRLNCKLFLNFQYGLKTPKRAFFYLFPSLYTDKVLPVSSCQNQDLIDFPVQEYHGVIYLLQWFLVFYGLNLKTNLVLKFEFRKLQNLT